MPPRSIPTDARLLAKVGTLYYEQGLTQQQIARRLQVSRPKVSRMLDEARQRGIVQITIVPQGGEESDLERALEMHYGLAEAVVIGADGEATAALRRRLGSAAADYLQRTLLPDAVIGLTWGSTLHAMVEMAQPLSVPGVRVVQTLGGVGSPQAEAHASDLARRLARNLGAQLDLLPVPGIVGSAQTRTLLLRDPHVQGTLEMLDAITVAFVGIGALSTNPIFEDGMLSARELLPAGLRTQLEEKDVTGDIALRFFDAEGRFVPNLLDDRLIGISAAQLQRVPYVVGVAGGAPKVDVIRAALIGELVNVLITDADTARALLADPPYSG